MRISSKVSAVRIECDLSSGPLIITVNTITTMLTNAKKDAFDKAAMFLCNASGYDTSKVTIVIMAFLLRNLLSEWKKALKT